MRMRVSFGLLVLIPLLSASLAQAESEYGIGDPGVYLAVSGLFAWDVGEWDSGNNENGGATFRAGVRVGAPLAFELQGDYTNLKAWRKVNRWDMTLNFRVYPTQLELLKGFVPDFVQPYVVAGAGVMGGDPAGDKYQLSGAFRLGLGSDFYLTEQLALSLGCEWVTGTSFWSDAEALNLTLGLQYNF